MERNFMQYALRKFQSGDARVTLSDLSIGELNLRISFEARYFDPGESNKERVDRLDLIKKLESIRQKKWKAIINGGR